MIFFCLRTNKILSFGDIYESKTHLFLSPFLMKI